MHPLVLHKIILTHQMASAINELILHSMKKSVALHTLGCKLNFSETSTIGRLLEQDGFVKKEFTEVADVYVINTCSVTDYTTTPIAMSNLQWN